MADMTPAILALTMALAATQATAQEAMTDDEKLDFWYQIEACYERPSFVTDTSVTVRFEMDERGRVVDGVISAPNGLNSDSESDLFEAARVAVLACGTRGYDLPEEKYIYWQTVEMTFGSPSSADVLNSQDQGQ